MAVKRYNGSSWDTVAGLGAQGAAAQSSSITTWVKTATGGETSLTGSSDSSTTLAYTPGQEQFFINGVLQVRGSDYTATNGTSITGITALVAGDIATVTTVNAFSVTGAVPLSTVTANGDLIVGTSSGAVGRLGVGSTGQLLTVSGGSPTWAAPPSGGKLLQVVSGTTTTQTVIDSTTFTDTTLTATITPTSATSKILVIYSQQYRYQLYAGGTQGSGLKLLRGSTTIQSYGGTNRLGAATSQLQSSLGGGEVRVVVSGNYLDSPATTSATTYKIQLAPYTVSSSGLIIANEDTGSISVITLMEIGA